MNSGAPLITCAAAGAWPANRCPAAPPTASSTPRTIAAWSKNFFASACALDATVWPIRSDSVTPIPTSTTAIAVIRNAVGTATSARCKISQFERSSPSMIANSNIGNANSAASSIIRRYSRSKNGACTFGSVVLPITLADLCNTHTAPAPTQPVSPAKVIPLPAPI